jgi:DNA-directed RNA polymerase delta subunit
LTSKAGAPKRKNRPKITASPALWKETLPSSSYDDSDDEDDKDGEDITGRIISETPIAAVEGLDDDNNDDGAGEESGEVDSNSREKATPPCKKEQRRLYQDAVEN